ncbi:hypothetical protein ACFZB2_40740 [Streptomyces bobili]|uniref:hypothetical protein n=1 Tax=Streptomyces bobili TaxID=67280 RepID=UPI0036E891CC
MSSLLRVQGRIGQRTLLLTTAAVPLTGWAVHAVALHRQLAATRRDPLTGLLRRDAYTARARPSAASGAMSSRSSWNCPQRAWSSASHS